MYRRVFKFHRWESVKLSIYGLSNLDLKHILLKLSTKFYLSMQLSNNLVVNNALSSLSTRMSLLSLVVCQDGGRT